MTALEEARSIQEPLFGPCESLRFGKSLGVNPLPAGARFCNFDCIYCECANGIPFREFNTLPARLGFCGKDWEAPLATAAWNPSVDIFENDNEVVIKAELPIVVYARGNRGGSWSMGEGIKTGAIVGFLLWLTPDFTLYGLTNIANLTRTVVDPLLEIVHGGIGGFFIALVLGRMPAASRNLVADRLP
jgi:hypothetical protein